MKINKEFIIDLLFSFVVVFLLALHCPAMVDAFHDISNAAWGLIVGIFACFCIMWRGRHK